MRIISKILTIITLALIPFMGFSRTCDIYIDGLKFAILSKEERTCELFGATNGRLENGIFTVPSSVEDCGIVYSVTSIRGEAGSRVFPSGMTQVNLPNTLLNIGEYSFFNCGVENISIPNSVKTIEESAFYMAYGLKTITIPESIIYIGEAAFSYCPNLEYIYGKFSSDDHKSLIVENTLIWVAKSVSSYTIPSNVSRIGGLALSFCNLSSISIPESVTSIGAAILLQTPIWNNSSNWSNGLLYINNCLLGSKPDYVSGKVTINSGTRLMASGAFSGCSSLREITIPESISIIPHSAFKNCNNLTSVNLPNTITNIGEEAFYYCKYLPSITFPSSLKKIGEKAFYFCNKLSTLNFSSSIEDIGDMAFYCCHASFIVLNEGLKHIGYEAFTANDITNLTIPNSVESINDAAFSNNSISSFYGKYATTDHLALIVENRLVAYACGAIASEYFVPNTIAEIGDEVFQGAPNILSIEIPSCITRIGNNCFSNTSINKMTTNLTSLEDVIIGENVFQYMSNNPTLYVPEGCKEMYQNAEQWGDFENIVEFGLESVSLADGNTYSNTENQLAHVNYTRNFKSTNWQGLYIPFDMSYEEWEPYATVAELAGVHMYDDDNDGTPDRTNIEFATLTSGKLIPNVPYLIKPKAVANVTFECTAKNLKAAPEVDGSVYSCTPRWKYSLIGTYTNRTDLVEPNIYSLGQGKFRRNNADVPPFRFYLEMTKQQGGYWGAPGKDQFPTEIEISVDGETLSGIADIFTDTMPDSDDDCYYDLQGRKVENPSGGIFIHKGKLLLFK